MLSEYPLAVTQVIVVVFLLTGPDRWRRTMAYGLGALPMALLMVAYNKAITGAWLDFPYSHVPAMWVAMRTGFGMRLPDPSAMWELSFGQYRGLALYAPILLAGVPALVAHFFSGPNRRRSLVLVLLAAYLVLIELVLQVGRRLCLGPRHLTPFIILVAYEGRRRWPTWKRWRWSYIALAMCGALISVLAAATNPLPGESAQAPLFQEFIPKFARGELTSHNLLVELLEPAQRALPPRSLVRAGAGSVGRLGFMGRPDPRGDPSPSAVALPPVREPSAEAIPPTAGYGGPTV